MDMTPNKPTEEETEEMNDAVKEKKSFRWTWQCRYSRY